MRNAGGCGKLTRGHNPDPLAGHGQRALQEEDDFLAAAANVAANKIAHRGSDLLRLLQHDHVASALDLSHFAIGQSVREGRSSFF